MMEIAICTMRIRESTTEKDVRKYLYHLFDVSLAREVYEELIEKFRIFKAEGLSGRISYDIHSGSLTIKEDNLTL